MTNESLSEKRKELIGWLVQLQRDNVSIQDVLDLIARQDKEAVMKLKEKIENWNFKDDIIKSWTICRIDEIFGEELSK